MESRKVQKVGASTLSVSLPKDWVTEHGLRKGDLVLLDPLKDGSLRVTAGHEAAIRASEQPEYVVDADRCDEPGMLARVVVGNYVIGRNALRIRSKSRIKSEHLQEVREVANKLMGMGIMTETPDEIEIAVSIEPTRFPMATVIKRLYTLGATMQKEAVEALERMDRQRALDAMAREDEADKQYWLALRLILTAQSDPQLAEKLGFQAALPIVGNRLICKNLEHVADYAEHIARNVVDIVDGPTRPDAELVRRIRRTSDHAASIVADGVSCIFQHDLKLANRAILTKDKVEETEEEMLDSIVARHEDPALVANVRAIAWSLRRIAEYGSEIAVIGINRYLERDSAVCKPLEGSPGTPGP